MANKIGAANPVQANNQMRAALLASAPRMRKNLGSSNLVLGGTTRVKLFNVGVLTKLCMLVSAPLTIGTAAAVPSPKAPYNLLTRVRVTDYDGTDRVNVSGFQLFVLNCVRKRMPFGWNVGGPIFDANGSTEKSGIIANPSVPTAVGNGTLSFYLEVPLAFDQESDLRGAILSQTAIGEMFLSIDTNASLITQNDCEAVYTGAATSTVAVTAGQNATVNVWQEYLLPQQIGNQVPLPAFDLMTVYELNGMVRSSDNLAVGQEKLFNYPNVRSVIGAYFNYVSGGAMAAANVTQLRLIANGNNVLLDYSNNAKLIEQRNYSGGDLSPGAYWLLHRSKPIETALFGNVQAGITPAVVGAGANFEICFESFYTKGAMLPGLSQGN